MIDTLVPAGVAVSWTAGDVLDTRLFPEELAHVRGAAETRRREFAAVRHSARVALTALGVPTAPILPGRGGAPNWPPSVVGSMTHCHRYRAAAVAHRSRAAAIGIDAEPNEVMPDGVLRIIARAEEMISLRTLQNADPMVCWDRLLFSTKESVFKVWYPMTGKWLGFKDASVSLGTDGRFRATLLPPEAPTRRLNGRWRVSNGLIGTAIVVRAGTDAEAHGTCSRTAEWSPENAGAPRPA